MKKMRISKENKKMGDKKDHKTEEEEFVEKVRRIFDEVQDDTLIVTVYGMASIEERPTDPTEYCIVHL